MLADGLRMSMKRYRLIDFFCDGLLWGRPTFGVARGKQNFEVR